LRCKGYRVGGLGINYIVCANKMYLVALCRSLHALIAEVTCECNLSVEVTCPESSRGMSVFAPEFWLNDVLISRNLVQQLQHMAEMQRLNQT
jgi:hypothetical protein